MVVVTELDQVGEVRRAAASPGLDVMRVDEAAFAASREAAATVPALQRAHERGRHAARPPADRQRPPVALEDADDAAIAGQAAGGFGMEAGAAVELADPVVALACQRAPLDVDDDLVSLTPATPGGTTD